MQEILDKIAALVPTLDGWCPVEKAQWLAKWIVGHWCASVVEIGVFGGRSLIPMALAMQEVRRLRGSWPGRVVGVDSYSNADSVESDFTEEGKKWWGAVDLVAIKKRCESAIEEIGLKDVCSLMIVSSGVGVTHFADGTLDLVHVDGGHSEPQSTGDVKLWWPKLRMGGVMVMDDTHWDSVRAARNIAARLGKQVQADATWEAFQKVPDYERST